MEPPPHPPGAMIEPVSSPSVLASVMADAGGGGVRNPNTVLNQAPDLLLRVEVDGGTRGARGGSGVAPRPGPRLG